MGSVVDNTIENPEACGIGMGPECCIWIMMGPDGFECARNTEIHGTIIERASSMTAKRAPVEPRPDCQLS